MSSTNNTNETKALHPSLPKEQRWFPLESNPTLMNSYISKLGFSTDEYRFIDVYSTEDWALDMIPQPVVAVLVLYPLTEKMEAAEPTLLDHTDLPNHDVWFMQQRIGNACGTIGLLHALLNVPEPVRTTSIGANSWLSKFYQDCPNTLDPMKKAERLEGDTVIATLHDQATSSEDNQTSRGATDDEVETHFIALTHVNGRLWELDGRRKGPKDHGVTTQESLLKDGSQVVQELMARDPTELRFTILALAPHIPEEEEE
jgi:ubiquitin carboxyl-terminal hydrolase L3